MNRADVANAIYEFFEAVDAQDWPALRAAMTSPIHIDYSSMGGGAPAGLSAETVVEGWAQLLPGFDHTHHQLGQLHITVDGSAGAVRAYVVGVHLIGDRDWTVVGTYDMTWTESAGRPQLSSLRLNFKYQTGDSALPDEARARVAD